MNIAAGIQTDAFSDRNRLSRLHGEHAILEARIKGLHRRAYGDWTDLDGVWSEFTRDLADHMAFEENELFDWFVREHPEQEPYVSALLADHEKIRRTVERLGVEIQLHVVRAETVEALLDALEQHSISEQQVFYPWLEGKLN